MRVSSGPSSVPSYMLDCTSVRTSQSVSPSAWSSQDSTPSDCLVKHQVKVIMAQSCVLPVSRLH